MRWSHSTSVYAYLHQQLSLFFNFSVCLTHLRILLLLKSNLNVDLGLLASKAVIGGVKFRRAPLFTPQQLCFQENTERRVSSILGSSSVLAQISSYKSSSFSL